MELKDRVSEYVKEHQGALTSDIIEAMGEDPLDVMDALNELAKEGSVIRSGPA